MASSTADSDSAPLLSIGRLASSAGVHVETIRYYQRLGLIATPPKAAGSIRRYGPADIRCLQFIRRAKQLGFSLKNIGLLLQLDASDCADVCKLAEEKLADVAQRVSDLKAVARALEGMIHQCRSSEPSNCPIIDALNPPGA